MQNLLTHLLLCSTHILTSTTKPTMLPMFTISTRITLTTKLPLKKSSPRIYLLPAKASSRHALACGQCLPACYFHSSHVSPSCTLQSFLTSFCPDFFTHPCSTRRPTSCPSRHSEFHHNLTDSLPMSRCCNYSVRTELRPAHAHIAERNHYASDKRYVYPCTGGTRRRTSIGPGENSRRRRSETRTIHPKCQ